MSTPGVPSGYHTVTPYITVKGAADAIEFYKRAFGAQELHRMPGPDGQRLMHAEIRIGDSVVMLSDEFPEFGSGTSSPKTLGGTTHVLHIYSPDVDADFKRATDAGATPLMPPADMFWGDRYSQVEDPFGQRWAIMTHKEDVAPEEMERRAKAFFAGGKP